MAALRLSQSMPGDNESTLGKLRANSSEISLDTDAEINSWVALKMLDKTFNPLVNDHFPNLRLPLEGKAHFQIQVAACFKISTITRVNC